ncbi:hypothetical protein C8T65DRAFT_741963 [Cerioporus squamosus]|nr:hypothetical protein C8T65DRAFT_741963 [Cerioporus squamosus]
MTTPRIPLELQELVIDLLDDDEDLGIVTVTLRSCTLTCRAWLPRSRRRLYHRLRLFNIRPTVLNKLVELISGDLEVSSMVRDLWIRERPQKEGEGDEDGRAEEVDDEGNDDEGEYDEEDRNHGDHLEQQRETRPVKDIIHAGAVLPILARKLPCLASLIIDGAQLNSSPARLPILLAGFPALTTLYLNYVAISSYGAFQRMLAAAPALRRLNVVDVTWTSTHISPTCQYFRLRCPPLTYLAWSPGSSLSDEQSDCAVLAHLIRNLHVRGSLEHLYLRDSIHIDIDNIIAIVTSDRFPDSLILPNLSTLKLDIYVHEDTAQDELSGFLKSATRLIATLWPSGIHAQRRRTLTLELLYPGGTLTPVADADSSFTFLHPVEDSILERLLLALKDVSAELEDVFAPTDGAGSTAEFLFMDDSGEDVSESAEAQRAFIVSLRSRVAGIFPELHQRGILSVKFLSWIQNRELYVEWVEDSKGNFEGIPYRPESLLD